MATAASGTAAVGTIKVVTGDVKVIGVDGVARQAHVGDKVFAKEAIQTNANAIVQVQLENGRTLDLGRDSKIALDDDVLNVGQAPTTAPATAGTDIAALQAQIAAGADPSKVAEATAAGGAPGAGGTADGSGGSAVTIDQANSIGNVTSGFGTDPAGIAFPDLPPGVLPVPQTNIPVVSVSVSVQVQVAVNTETGGTTPTVPTTGIVPQLLAAGNAVVEGTGLGSRTVNFVISLDQAYDQPVTVTYQIQPGSASAPTDFNGVLTGTITIPAGQTSFIVPVSIVQDSGVEGNETFNIVLTGATNATISATGSSAVAIIIDDDLQARADTNWAKEDSTNASGNVFQAVAHNGAPDAAARGDVADANTAADTTGLSIVNPGTIAGLYGTLMLNANGSYTYTLYASEAEATAAGHPGNYDKVQSLGEGESLSSEELPENFSYTARNGFNNTSVGNLNIEVFGTNDEPRITAQTDARVSDEGLEGGIRDDIGDQDRTPNDDTATFYSGTITVGDDDTNDQANLTVVLREPTTELRSGDEVITWTGDNTGSLIGSIYDGEVTIITITITNAGVYTVTLLGPIDHAGVNVEDDKAFNVVVTVSDGIATTDGNLTVTVEDDSPVVTLSERNGYVPTVDESNFGSNANEYFGDAFNFNGFGADGPAASNAHVYSLGITSAASNLTDSLTQEAVTLSVVGGVVIGSSATGGEVFRVSVDANGYVTLNQSRAVMHPNATDPDDAVDLTGLVTLTLTATDFDGDQASATANIGSSLIFRDDGPSIVIATDASGNNVPTPTLTVDETTFATDASTSFNGMFTTTHLSTDGGNTVVYSLNAVAGNSGLVDSLTGENVVLSISGGIVFGKTATGGLEVFRVTVDANTGLVTLNESRAVMHTPDTGVDQPTTLSAVNLVTLTATITDTDLDKSAATINIGQALTFNDDAPAISTTGATLPGLTVDETTFATDASASFTGMFTTTHLSTDGGNTVVYSLNAVAGNSGLVDSLTGENVVLSISGGIVFGKTATGGLEVFRVTVDANTGLVTLNESRAVMHTPDTGVDQPTTLSAVNLVTLTATITDTDLDKSAATINIGQALTFKDDGPTLSSITNLVAQNNAGNYIGNWVVAPGADGYNANVTGGNTNSAEGINVTLTNLTSISLIKAHQTEDMFSAGVYQGEMYTAYLDVAMNQVFFTLFMKTDGTYVFNLVQPNPSVTVTEDFNVTGSIGGFGGDLYLEQITDAKDLLDPKTDVKFTAHHSFVSNTDLGAVSGVNSSNNGLGVSTSGTGGGLAISQNESMTLQFFVGDADTLGSTHPTTTTAVDSVRIGFDVADNNTGNDTATVRFILHYFDNTTAVLADQQVADNQTVTVSGTKKIASVDVVNMDADGETFLITTVGTTSTTTILPTDLALNFSAQVVDGDGDLSAAVPFTVTIDTNNNILSSTGNDILYGETGVKDTFVWGAGNAGADAVQNFDSGTAVGSGTGDILNLKDLLVGEAHTGTNPGNLGAYLDFSFTGGNTVVSVHATGGAAVTQTIVLQGVDLTAGNTLPESQIITNLLAANKLITD